MAGILWTIIVVLFIIWLLGFLAFHVGGSLIHIILLVVLILIVINLLTGRGLRV